MKKIVLLILTCLSSMLYSQTYEGGSMAKKTHNTKFTLLEDVHYCSGVTITTSGDYSTYDVSCNAVSYHFVFVKKTNKGPKYNDKTKGDFYIDDNLEYGSFTITEVERVGDKIITFYITGLKNHKNSNFKYND